MAPKLLKLCLQDSAVALHVSTISVRVYFAVYLWSEPFLIVITQILDFAVFLVSKPRQRYFALNWWWPIASQVMFARMEFWGNSWGCKFATAVFPFTRQSGECILLERDDRGNSVLNKFSSFDNSKLSHFIFWAHCIWLYNCERHHLTLSWIVLSQSDQSQNCPTGDDRWTVPTSSDLRKCTADELLNIPRTVNCIA